MRPNMSYIYWGYIIWDIQIGIQVAAWNYKNFIAKDFDGNTLKMKAASPIQVIKNKEKSFQLFPDQARFLILHLFLLRARLDAKLKQNSHEIGHN